MAMHKGHAQKGKAKGTITNSGKPYMEDFNESFNNENLPVVEAEALRGRKHMSEPDDDIDITKGGDMMTMLDRFGADINKAFLAKRKRLKTSTKSSVKTSHQKIEQLWRVQQRDRSKVTEDYCTQFNAVFSQWDTDVQKSKDNEEKLLSMFQHPQKMFQHKRASQRLKTLKQLLEQYIQVYYLIVFFNMVILNLCLSWFSHATLFCWAGRALIRWRRPMSASRVLHRASCARRWHCFRKRFSVTQ
uniref:XLR/SYCP3/FAM9 domain-containing protein n=1 Tax=Oncorhynchus tshawytscha TaxID=74940 RepID=A0AAZ3RRH3_ONCTS